MSPFVKPYPGQRVKTPYGTGSVAYARLNADGTAIVGVSVVLDHRRHAAGYAGSMFAPKDVETQCPTCGREQGRGGLSDNACCVAFFGVAP